jgi:hypothetical protein
VLWLPSKLWFTFLARRLEILNKTHEKIYRSQPQNYGVLSGLFAYLMQSVMFSPPKVNTYVQETLAALEYKRNCDRFGMFFLDKLDVTNPAFIDGILERDDASVKRTLGPLIARVRVPIATRAEAEGDLMQYPIGATPTWLQIRRSLERDPTVLMCKWEGLPFELEKYGTSSEDSTEAKAAEIFIKFTRQMWMSLHKDWRIDPKTEREPKTLEAALFCWAVDSVLQHCDQPIFRPCNTGLAPTPGRHVASFGDRRELYFPKEDIGPANDFWSLYTEEPGYIHDYRECMRKVGIEDLDACLEEILMQCQCLPDSMRNKSTGKGWRVQQKRLVILTNPRFYSIRAVGTNATASRKRLVGVRAAPANQSLKSRLISMLVLEGYSRQLAETTYNARRGLKKRNKNEQRSGRAKNKRAAPRRNVNIINSEEEMETDGGGKDGGEEGAEWDGDHSEQGNSDNDGGYTTDEDEEEEEI